MARWLLALAVVLLQPNLAVGISVERLRSQQQRQPDKETELSSSNTKEEQALGRANALLSQMKLDEKVNMLHGNCMSCPYVGLIPGNARLGVPPLNQHDGPQGFRNEPFASRTSTSWPGAMAMAATFDPEAVYKWGAAMGREFRAKGSNVQLGPGLNIARVPLNGRNFEYLAGEDPYLGYSLARPVTKGIQENNVIACGKHFVGNSQEANRMTVSEDIDERTLFEMYYPPFAGAIEAGIGSIMCSYNRINSTYSCENPTTLGHLKNDLGFRGFVMSDWGATHTPSLHQGLDMEMPVATITNGFGLWVNKVSVPDIDSAVRRTLTMMYEVGVMDQPAETWDPAKFKENVSTPEHIQLARRLSAESTVLLKNDDDILPLRRNQRLALIGFASENAAALAYGHGSGEVKPSHYVSPLAGISAVAGPEAVVFNDGKDIEKAAELARSSQVAIVFVGGSATEGGDRASLSLDGACRVTTMGGKNVECDAQDHDQNRLVSTVAAANPKTIVVASVPGAFLLPWIHEVKAALVNFMPGQEAGNAIADVLYGIINPSAKLPITLPNRENELDMVSKQYPGEADSDYVAHSVYSEGLLVGYRYYDSHVIGFDTGFPFGHGLSYTFFRYSDLSVSGRTVSFTVTNGGSVPGQEVAQLYVKFPWQAQEPPMQLKGFKKTQVLAPGESTRLEIVLDDRATSIWDTNEHKWVQFHGTYALHVASSSRDVRLLTQVDY